MSNFAFVITAYKQSPMVRKNVERIRNEYKIFNNSDIIIVSTSETPHGFQEIEDDFSNVHFLEFPNAPGSSNCNWFKLPVNPKGPYFNWRHAYLPPRILISMSRAITYAYDLGINRVLHLHSDTYWDSSQEDKLNDLVKHLDNTMLIGDTSAEDEQGAKETNAVPPMIHICPEGLFMNLDKCHECGYAFNFPEIYSEKTNFRTHDFGSIESILGQYAIYCLTGQNVTKITDEIPKKYFENVYFRCNRSHHGNWDGLINLPGQQPDGH